MTRDAPRDCAGGRVGRRAGGGAHFARPPPAHAIALPLADKKSKDTCADYVTKKSKNCKKDGFDGTPAESACPVTCGAC